MVNRNVLLGIMLVLMLTTADLAHAAGEICKSDTNTFTAKVNLYAGQLGTQSSRCSSCCLSKLFNVIMH